VRIRNHRHSLTVILLGIFAVILICLAIKWISSPAKGTVKTLTEKPDSHQTTNPQKLEGNFFIVKYPADYTVKVHEASDSGILEKAILLGTDASSKELLISFNKTQETDLSNIAAIQYRRLKSTLYLEKNVALDGRNGLLYERKDSSYEKTAFFIRDGIMTVISLTAPFANEDLNKDYTYIFDNFFWK